MSMLPVLPGFRVLCVFEGGVDAHADQERLVVARLREQAGHMGAVLVLRRGEALARHAPCDAVVSWGAAHDAAFLAAAAAALRPGGLLVVY